eukprot:CAMPEP_0182609716 /NCGR_PEP_ID=MMETSP1330-20130603/4024_1 /TAXON_ID=464278 /ORGANISM="Picochlorum sp., Strain RCC944" /LENGTH=143 /DNA_ID=CAMNT_0024828603 /DNA_START=134 /DNA_END=566 /DNA_ORIENTATION=+
MKVSVFAVLLVLYLSVCGAFATHKRTKCRKQKGAAITKGTKITTWNWMSSDPADEKMTGGSASLAAKWMVTARDGATSLQGLEVDAASTPRSRSTRRTTSACALPMRENASRPAHFEGLIGHSDQSVTPSDQYYGFMTYTVQV